MFQPNAQQIYARACADLRLGLPVVIRNSQRVSDRAGAQSAYIVFAVETLSRERFEELKRQFGASFAPEFVSEFASESILELAVSFHRAQTLKMPVYDGDLARIKISADAGFAWLQAVVNPVMDLNAPFKGPFEFSRSGDAEAARAGLLLAKQACLLPAVLCVAVEDAHSFDLSSLHQIDIKTVFAAQDLAFTRVAHADVPLQVSTLGHVHVFRKEFGDEEHYAIEVGQVDCKKPVLTRLHSACFTGDLMGSLKCDCGPQLRAALAQMGAEGGGILLYLNQEGRGIGLANKMRAYTLQDQGFDTVEANHRLGFEDDERDFRIGARLLTHLGAKELRLLTNNPAKIAKMESCGLRVVERVPLKVGHTPQNADYLAVKKQKSGHLL